MLAVPIIRGGDVLGVLQVTNRQDGRTFDEEDAQSLLTFAEYVGRSLRGTASVPGAVAAT